MKIYHEKELDSKLMQTILTEGINIVRFNLSERPTNVFFKKVEHLLKVGKNIRLRIYGKTENWNDLSFFQYLNLLKFLQFDPYDIKDLSFLKNLPNLEYLRIGFPEISSVSLKMVEKLPQLKHLALTGEFYDLNVLLKLPKLKSLGIWYRQKLDCTIIAELDQLTQLNIGHIKDCLNSNDLKKLESLNYIFLSYMDNLKDLSFLSSLNDIEYIKLSNLLYCSSIPNFDKCLKLKRISIENLLRVKEFKNIKTAKQLEEIVIRGANDSLKGENFEFLLQMQNLNVAYIPFLYDNKEFLEIIKNRGIQFKELINERFLKLEML